MIPIETQRIHGLLPAREPALTSTISPVPLHRRCGRCEPLGEARKELVGDLRGRAVDQPRADLRDLAADLAFTS